MTLIISLLFAVLNLINGILAIMLIIALEAQFWAIALAFGLYFIIRESLYKLFHIMGYHPKPDKIMIGSAGRGIEFAVFTKHTPDYLALYTQRSKKFQRRYFLHQLIFYTFILPVIAITGFRLIDNLSSPSNSGFTVFFLILLILGLSIGLGILTDKWKEWFVKHYKANILLIEREHPILSEKDCDLFLNHKEGDNNR